MTGRLRPIQVMRKPDGRYFYMIRFLYWAFLIPFLKYSFPVWVLKEICWIAWVGGLLSVQARILNGLLTNFLYRLDVDKGLGPVQEVYTDWKFLDQLRPH